VIVESRTIPVGEIKTISPGNRLQSDYPDTRYIGYCAVFKVREEMSPVTRRPGTEVLEGPATRRSLKTQQHAGNSLKRIPLGEIEDFSGWVRAGRNSLCPSPVDMSSDRMRSEGRPRSSEELGPSPALGALAVEGSLERR